MKRLLALALLVAGCAEKPIPTPERLAEFRSEAREAYGALSIPSCGLRAALDREALLADERRRSAAVEARMPGPLRVHLDIARADVAYADRAEERCSDDSDPEFARRHIEDSKRMIAANLSNLERLAPALVVQPDQPKADPPDGAAFRRAARDLVELSRPRCPMSAGATNEELAAPASEELGRFRARLEGSRHAAHYDIAEADVAHAQRDSVVDCQDSAPRPDAELRAALLAEMKAAIAALEARLKKPAGRG
jgi:hypothetical protein